MSPILYVSDFEQQCKHLEKFTQTVRQKFVACRSRVFLHVWNCSSTVHDPNFLRPNINSSAANFLHVITYVVQHKNF